MTSQTATARACAVCGTDISHRRADAETCSPTHKRALSRRRTKPATTHKTRRGNYDGWNVVEPHRASSGEWAKLIDGDASEAYGGGYTVTRTVAAVIAWETLTKRRERYWKRQDAKYPKVTIRVGAGRPGWRCGQLLADGVPVAEVPPTCPVLRGLLARGWCPPA